MLDELRTSVRLRKVSDVPVGVFLSGGIDSSTNAALFSEGETSPVKTFSIGYEGEYESYRNELHYARVMAERGRRRASRAAAHAAGPDRLPARMVQLQDEPIADPVCVPVYYVSKLARDNGVIVAQVGEGADELFCGYPGWQTLVNLQGWDDLPRAARRQGGGLWPCCGWRAATTAAIRVAAPGRGRASRSSGAAPRPSPRRRRSGCCRPRLRTPVRRAHVVGGHSSRSASGSRPRRGSRRTSTG